MNIRNEAESHIKEFPHSNSMLKKLREDGYKIGLISNSGNFAIESTKNSTEILNYIDYKVFSFDVGTVKPDPKIYNEMLRVSGFKAKECLMIGDREEDDVTPPKEIGMHAILFNNEPQLRNDLAEYNILI